MSRPMVLALLALALLLSAGAVAFALDADEERADAPAPDHAMPDDARCAHMPEHCGGDAAG